MGEQADENRQSAAGSDESAQFARDAAISARDTTVEAKDETLSARDLARKWATEEEDTPVQDEEFSALHWAKVAERLAGTITNGMYFVGAWDLSDGFPPEPDGPGVPWYRITNNDVSAVMPVSAALEKIARKSNKGSQLIWDPIQKEWFVIDTSDEVWLVNGKNGSVVLNSEDVGALPDTGGRLSGNLHIPDKGKGIYLTDKIVVRSGGGSDGLLLLGGSEATEARFLMERLTLTNDFNQRGHSVYHEGFRPSPADIGALGDTGNQELTGAIYPKVPEGSADNDPSSWSDGYSLSAATGSAGYAAYGTLINSRTGAGRSLQILGYPDSGTPKLRFRVADPDDGSWLPHAEIYSSQNKPTATDVGLGNVDNFKQVRQYGNNRIQAASSFIIDGNETAGDEENVLGVLRLTLSNEAGYGSIGTVFFQAGHAQSVSTANNGAMVFGGYWGGFLHEANFKLLDAKKLTVQISGSSTRHPVYHEGNKPTPADIGAVAASEGEVARYLNVTGTDRQYRISSSSVDYSGEFVVTTNGVFIRKRNPDGSDSRSIGIRPDGSAAAYDGAWRKIYHENFKPTAADVGARPDSWYPAWNDVTGKPSTYPPSTHTHDYVPNSRTVNGKSLSSDISLTAANVGAEPTLATDRKRKITISTSDPSGGSDGDIWFKVE